MCAKRLRDAALYRNAHRAARPQLIFVEFAGVPGSGKSTLADALTDELRDQGVAVRRVNDTWRCRGRWGTTARRLQLAVVSVLRAPRLSFRTARLVYLSKQRSWRDCGSVLVNWYCKQQLMRRAERSVVNISDEGLLHAIWSVAYSASSRSALHHLANRDLVRHMSTVSWIVVRVSAEKKVAAAWLLGRNGTPNRLASDIGTQGESALDNAGAADELVQGVIDSMVSNSIASAVIDVANVPGEEPRSIVRSIASRVKEEVRRLAVDE